MMFNNHYIFFNEATGVAEHLAYNINPEFIQFMLQPGQVAVEVEDSTGWQSLTLQDVNREQTAEDTNG